MLQTFIEKAKKTHSDKYDYTLVKYVNSSTKVQITCPIHGSFMQSPAHHVHGRGCKQCGVEKRSSNKKSSLEKFKEIALKIHGNIFDYSQVIYPNNNKEKVKIICKEGHFFEQSPNSHLRGHGCPICKGINIRRKSLDVIAKCQVVHNNLYDYSELTYVNDRTKVTIICPDHGPFTQKIASHILGQGCPKCKYWKKETKLFNLLVLEFPDINISRQASPEWLEKQRFDFYFSDYNIAIEYNGMQHYEPVKIFGGLERYKKQIEYDLLKKTKCVQNNCILYEIPFFYKKADINNIIKNIKKIINGAENKIT